MPDPNLENTESATLVDIPARLFQDNSLVVITKSSWGGTATVKEGDEEIAGSSHFDNNYFKRGGIVLIGKEHLKPIQDVITRLDGYMSGMGKTFLLRGITIIKNSEWPEISKKIKEAQVEIGAVTSDFLASYPRLMEERTRGFDESHPQFAGRLNRYFPDVSDLEKSFGIRYVSFAITDASGLESVFSEERQRLRSVASQYVDSLAQEFRKSILDAVNAFKQSIEKAGDSTSEKVNQRSVDGFKNFLERIQRNDFLGDEEIMGLMNDLKFGIQRVEDWKVTGGNLQLGEIRKSLEAVIQAASDEGAAIAVARNFVSPVEIESEIEVPLLSVPVGGFGSTSEEEIEIEEGSSISVPR